MSKCPRCGRVFTSEQCLDYHLTKKKVKCNSVKCYTCNQMFNTISKLNIHKVTCVQNISDNKLSVNINNDIVCLSFKNLENIHIYIFDSEIGIDVYDYDYYIVNNRHMIVFEFMNIIDTSVRKIVLDSDKVMHIILYNASDKMKLKEATSLPKI